MAGDPILSKDDILWGIERIREGLADRGVTGVIKIIGGSAMILGDHAQREATVDIDAVVLIPQDVIAPIAARIAGERGWPVDWINLEAQGLYPAFAGRPIWMPKPELSDAALSIELATGEALLAMKLNASRPGRDDGDIASLMIECRIGTIAEADDLFAEYFRGESLPDKAVYLLRELGYPDGHDTMYARVPHEDPISVRVRRSRER